MAPDTSKLVYPDRSDWTLSTVLKNRARERPEQPLLQFEENPPHTYAEILEKSRRVAHGLRDRGQQPDEILLLMMPNCLEFVLTWFGVNLLGAAQAPVNNAYKGEFLSHVVNLTESSRAVVHTEYLERFRSVEEDLAHLEELIVVGDYENEPAPESLEIVPFGELLESEKGPVEVAVNPSDTAALHFTSGTTGPSKGSLMTHAQAHLMTELNVRFLDLDEDDISHSPLPFFHVNAQLIAIYSCLMVGAKAVIYPEFSASNWYDEIQASGATTTTLLGVMMEFVLNQPRRDDERDNDLETVWAVPCPEDLSAQLRDRFGVEKTLQCYGNTEVGIVCMEESGDVPADSCGTLNDEWFEARIVDPEDDEPVETGEVGEMLIRPRVPWITSQGYLNMPDHTVDAFRNLWFHTGDALKRDEEGYYYFVDRIKDRIRRRGENISSTQLEATIQEHDDVAEVAVVGVESEISGGEDEVKAVVVPASGEEIQPDAFVEWCEERMPYFAVPRFVEQRESLPKTPTNKVIKTDLEELGEGVWDRERS